MSLVVFILSAFFPLVLVEYLEPSTRGWVVPSSTQAFSLTVDLTGEGTASQEALYSQEDVDFSGVSSKVKRSFWRNWSQQMMKHNFLGETLVKQFCCEFMLIIVWLFIYIFCGIGKADIFCNRLSPASTRWPLEHQPAPNRQGSDEKLEAEFSILPRDARCVKAMAC